MLAVFRSLLRDRGVTGLAVVSMAAGIGLAAALASLADAILFRPLPVRDANRIVRIFTASADQTFGLLSYPDFDDFHRASRTVSGMVAQSQILVGVAADARSAPRVRMGLAVTADYFDVLGAPAALGRTFAHDETRAPVTVLAYSFWESEFSADTRIVGKNVRLSGSEFTVIGVARKDFGLDRFLHEDFYVPMGVYAAGLLPSTGKPLEERDRRYLNIYGRLSRGATIHQARAEFATIAARLASDYPRTNRGRRALVVTEFEARAGSNRTMPALAGFLVALAILTLAIVCANVAGLLLVRAEARAAETAVRVALGAGRARLLADGLLESAALVFGGAVFGIPLAWVAIRLVARAAVLPTDVRLAMTPALGGRVAFTIAGAMALLILVCGAAPVLGTRRDLTTLLKSARMGAARNGWRSALVTLEIALAAALVGCGGLVWSAIAKASRLDLGYRTDHVLVMTLDPAQASYKEARAREFYDRVLEGVRRSPGVRGAELAQSVPLGYSSAQRLITIEGEQEPRAVWMNIVTPGYFGLMHLRMIAGRTFDERDTGVSAPVVIVNEELARRCGLAGRILMNGRWLTVVGIVTTAAYFQAGESPRPYFYLPFSQNYASRMVLHVDAGTEAAPAVLGMIREVDANPPVSDVRPLADYLNRGALSNARIAITVLAMAAACGLLLALAGVYGVVAHAVALRRREIGVRMALGAGRPVVMIVIMRHGVRVVVTGTAGGLGMAVTAARSLAGLITGADHHDWLVLGAAALLIVLAGLAACLIPAWKAARLDPSSALR